MKIVKGLKVVAYGQNEVTIKQRIRIIDEEGLPVKAPTIEVRERKRDKESLEDAKKRAEEKLEREVEKFKNELRKRGYGVIG